ncbi:ATP-grasp domain-containing protein [Lipingzhangella sp. LS1_29]|uniref:ATP-grasp domain-containing protein n=1 Tax=Lipingzhangella rawalii TaxID=2055835 RepID=A0ABU2H8H5_9ACTN|nr:ATP-grasp domain-containing protein [Lipingzhangella rawalii]MDS1271606.1 ATP-grasp domain-containing protein [Lipingzhangella rawalii]
MSLDAPGHPAVVFVNTRRTVTEYAPAFQAARSLGYDVILVTDSVPEDEKRELATRVVVVDTTNTSEVLDQLDTHAGDFTIHGVVPWADRDMLSAANLVRELGLPGLGPDEAWNVRNKWAMRRALTQLPQYLPAFRVVHDRDGMDRALESVGYPGILKPTSGSGSKGIFRVTGPEEAWAAWTALTTMTSSGDASFRDAPGELIYEEFVEGPEFSAEGVVSGTDVHVAGFTSKSSTPDYYLEYGHAFPAQLTEADTESAQQMVREVLAELGLHDCAFHLEFKLTDQGPKLIEVAGRIGGDFISSHLVPLSLNRPFYADVIRVATGQQVAPFGAPEAYAEVRKILSRQEGRFSHIEGWESMLDGKWVADAVIERKVGAEITLPPADFMSSVVAAFIVKAPLGDAQTARDWVEETERNVRVVCA